MQIEQHEIMKLGVVKGFLHVPSDQVTLLNSQFGLLSQAEVVENQNDYSHHPTVVT